KHGLAATEPTQLAARAVGPDVRAQIRKGASRIVAWRRALGAWIGQMPARRFGLAAWTIYVRAWRQGLGALGRSYAPGRLARDARHAQLTEESEVFGEIRPIAHREAAALTR